MIPLQVLDITKCWQKAAVGEASDLTLADGRHRCAFDPRSLCKFPANHCFAAGHLAVTPEYASAPDKARAPFRGLARRRRTHVVR
ncbi:hypothetical protein [Accumulibacter sp.]|uniref:hypothetical protein n=1 Tax=Accumulibacter sp. TaxID=2053492 RepID=UPI00262176EF|nr:hypothetical protein [Accumulibacter sp.]